MKKRIVDSEGQPIVGAVLFDPDGQGVDVTDSAGSIKIDELKPGQYYFKMLGFQDFYFEPENSPEELVLTSTSYELGEVTVTGTKKKRGYFLLFLFLIFIIYKLS